MRWVGATSLVLCRPIVTWLRRWPRLHFALLIGGACGSFIPRVFGRAGMIREFDNRLGAGLVLGRFYLDRCN